MWRSELADTFVEVRRRAVVRARGARHAGTSNVLAARHGRAVGQGVWCETYWLPEADLVELGDGVQREPGCVVQTHLFHDRVLSLGPVTSTPGATLGPHSVVLPAASSATRHRRARRHW